MPRTIDFGQPSGQPSGQASVVHVRDILVRQAELLAPEACQEHLVETELLLEGAAQRLQTEEALFHDTVQRTSAEYQTGVLTP